MRGHDGAPAADPGTSPVPIGRSSRTFAAISPSRRRHRSPGRCGGSRRRSASSRPGRGRRPRRRRRRGKATTARARPASARPFLSGTTARRTSISSARPSRRSARRRRLSSPRVARHRQADPAALARGLPDGRAAPADGKGREVERRGLLGDERRGVRRASTPTAPSCSRSASPLHRSATSSSARSSTPSLREYFLDEPSWTTTELAALTTALFMLEGQFAYAGAAPARAPEPRARPPRLPGAAGRPEGA